MAIKYIVYGRSHWLLFLVINTRLVKECLIIADVMAKLMLLLLCHGQTDAAAAAAATNVMAELLLLLLLMSWPN